MASRRRQPEPNWHGRVMFLLLVGPLAAIATLLVLHVAAPESAGRLVTDQGTPVVHVGEWTVSGPG